MTKNRPANPEDLSDEALLEQVRADNDALELRLATESNGAILPGPGKQMQKVLTYLHHLLIDAGRLMTAEFDYEASRAEALDQAEQAFEKMKQRQGLVVADVTDAAQVIRQSGLHVVDRGQ